MILNDDFYLDLAINEAWKYQGLTYPNPAVGSVVVGEHGEILSIEAHREAGSPHAEVLAIASAYYKLTNDQNIKFIKNSADIHDYLIKNAKDIFYNCSIYVSLEPCNHWGKTPPCSLLIKNLKFKKVIIGAKDENIKAMGGAETIANYGIETVFLNSKNAKDLLEPFNLWREKERFVLFKMAQTLNGDINGGIISSANSRQHVHNIRTKIDLLVIGGETVRNDRPTHDSRLSNLQNKKAPNILILSKNKPESFDKNIKLFSVKNRTVEFGSDLKNRKGFILIEGGFNFFNFVRDEVDWLLLYISPKIRNRTEINLNNLIEIGFETMFVKKMNDGDIVCWLKRI